MIITSGMVRKITTAALVAAPIFAEQKWTWKSDEAAFVPGVEDIMESLLRRIEDADSDDDMMISSGRLVVRLVPDENEGQIYLHLGYFDLKEVTV